jgi:rod shape determining protein RodA
LFQIDRRIITHFDFLVPLLIIPIIASSYYLVSEANEFLANKQLVYYGVGVLAWAFFFLLPIRKLEWLIPFFYYAGVVLLALVLFVGTERLGATRWIELPFVHFTIQPSEIFKPAFLLMLCYLIRQNPPPEGGYRLKKFIYISVHILVPFALIALEPDLGTALVLAIVGFGVLFVVGVDKRIWLTLALLFGIFSYPAYTYGLHDYQKKRVENFLSDDSKGYHVEQSIVAIGSGGLSGKDREDATQTHFKFLPIATSDFIFAYLVERGGFFGGLTLLSLYIILILHLITLSIGLKKDYFAAVMAVGIAFLLFVYTSVNIAMTVGFAPVVGVPLPFFSYGGSSFITFMIFFGIFENMMAFRFDPMHRSVKYSSKPTRRSFKER